MTVAPKRQRPSDPRNAPPGRWASWMADLRTRVASMFGTPRLYVRQRFDVLEQSPAGRHSRVFKARDRKSGVVVSLKLIDVRKSPLVDEVASPPLPRPSEAQILSSLSHPHIVKLLEHGETSERQPYLTMEFVEGTVLSAFAKYYSMQLEGRRLMLIRQIAEALAAVHKAGFLHRDVCAENVILSTRLDSLTLIDFGSAVPATPEYASLDIRDLRPDYLPPELLKRRVMDHKADIFGFGTIAYLICTGRLPWDSEATETSVGRAWRRPTDIRKLQPTLNMSLSRAIHSCMLTDPEGRCGSMDEFLAMLQGVENETEPKANLPPAPAPRPQPVPAEPANSLPSSAPQDIASPSPAESRDAVAATPGAGPIPEK